MRTRHDGWITKSALATALGFLLIPGCDAAPSAPELGMSTDGEEDAGDTDEDTDGEYEEDEDEDEDEPADEPADEPDNGGAGETGGMDDDPTDGGAGETGGMDDDPTDGGAGETGGMDDEPVDEPSDPDACEGLSNEACAANDDCFWQVVAQDGETLEQCVSDICPALPQQLCDLQSSCTFDPVDGCHAS